jgi:hypothetical protein
MPNVEAMSRTRNRYHGRHKDPPNPDITETTGNPNNTCNPIITTKTVSNIRTQNVHDIKHRKIDSENRHIPNEYDYTKIEHIVGTMKELNIDAYFLQETWWEDNKFDEVINGYHMFRHNASLGNHNYKGVAIILSPRYYEGWIAAGKQEPKVGKSVGRIISLTIKLECNNQHGHKVKGKNGKKYISLSLVSAYHPHREEGDEYAMFVDELDGHLENITHNNSNEVIKGANINADIGRRDDICIEEYKHVMGPHGHHRRNSKGETLLGMY